LNALGIWSHAAYQVRSANKPRALLRFRSTFQIIEGRVAKVARVKHRHFINFGSNWRTDFTIGFNSRMRKRLIAAGVELNNLKGRRIRIRGWIERRGGPFIFIHSPEQLEILSPSHTASPSQNHPSTAPSTSSNNTRANPMPRTQKRPAEKQPGVLDL